MSKKTVCHNELDSIDFTYRTMVDDLELALCKPRFEGDGKNRKNALQKKTSSWLDLI